jgi:hypothetical protein
MRIHALRPLGKRTGETPPYVDAHGRAAGRDFCGLGQLIDSDGQRVAVVSKIDRQMVLAC